MFRVYRAPLKISFTEWTPCLNITITIKLINCVALYNWHMWPRMWHSQQKIMNTHVKIKDQEFTPQSLTLIPYDRSSRRLGPPTKAALPRAL